MTKKLSKIKFSDFSTIDELIYYLIENDIDKLIDENANEFTISDIDYIWEKYKDIFKRKFEK